MLRHVCGRESYQSLSRRLSHPPSLSYHFHSSTIRRSSPPPPRYVRFSPPSNPNSNSGGGRRNGKSFLEDRTWPVKLGAGLAGMGVIYYVSCLEQVPETGRWRFIAVSPETEAEVGKMVLQETMAQYKGRILPQDHPVTMHVKRIVHNVLSASHLGIVKGYSEPQKQLLGNDFGADDVWSASSSTNSPPSAIASANKEWAVVVVDDRKFANAAATPGTIIVFTGILPVCKDEQGLAAVLSHEISHVVARHTAERLSSQTIATALGLFLSIFGVSFGFSATLNTLLLELPNSRLQESEADLIGLRLMSKACYDPRASPAMFARLAQLESQASRGGFGAPEFLRTHPTSESRVRDLQAHLGEGYDIIAANPACAELQDQVQAFRETTRLRNAFNLGHNGHVHHKQHGEDEEEVWR
ncbi:peptidase family M48-domain-containing protein [Lentinula aff. detonsa]|uniref:Peptidase family M48-domain-containing protein n=1 Tax=Lentinula aff. detonsa TaxID=2804958 RepID=A0AA38KV39_9AGAR|nr:peptidase family M48-domain-containing protein [Lentinula aff. detonsa]